MATIAFAFVACCGVAFAAQNQSRPVGEPGARVDFGTMPEGTFTQVVEPDFRSGRALVPKVRVTLGYPGATTLGTPVLVELDDKTAPFDGYVQFSAWGGGTPVRLPLSTDTPRASAAIWNFNLAYGNVRLFWIARDGSVLNSAYLRTQEAAYHSYVDLLVTDEARTPTATEVDDRYRSIPSVLHEQNSVPLIKVQPQEVNASALWYSGVRRIFVTARAWNALSAPSRATLQRMPFTFVLDLREPPPTELASALPITWTNSPSKVDPDGHFVRSTEVATPTSWSWRPKAGYRWAGSRECPIWVGESNDFAVSVISPTENDLIRDMPSTIRARIRHLPFVETSTPHTRVQGKLPPTAIYVIIASLALAAIVFLLVNLKTLSVKVLAAYLALAVLSIPVARHLLPQTDGKTTGTLIQNRGETRYLATRIENTWSVEAVEKTFVLPGELLRYTSSLGILSEDSSIGISGAKSIRYASTSPQDLNLSAHCVIDQPPFSVEARERSGDSAQLDFSIKASPGSEAKRFDVAALWSTENRLCFARQSQRVAGSTMTMPCEEPPREIQLPLSANAYLPYNFPFYSGAETVRVFVSDGSTLLADTRRGAPPKRFRPYSISNSEFGQVERATDLLGPFPVDAAPRQGKVLLHLDGGFEELTLTGSGPDAVQIEISKSRPTAPRDLLLSLGLDARATYFLIDVEQFRALAQAGATIQVQPKQGVTIWVTDEQ